MSRVMLRWTARQVVALTAVGMLFALAGCAPSGAWLPSAPAVTTLRIGAAISEPVWSHSTKSIYALTESSRVAKIDPYSRTPGNPPVADTVLSRPFEDLGENLSTSPTGRNVVFVPQPKQGHVTVLEAADLHKLGTLQAGPAPSYVSSDFGSRALMVLSEDGSTVTTVDLYDHEIVSSQPVPTGPEAEVDAAKRGRLLDYHVIGPSGVFHYKGPPNSVHKKGELSLIGGESAGDLVKASRVYVAERDTGRLVAIDANLFGPGLTVVASGRVGQPISHIGVDETRIYVATESKLVVFETNSFEGFDSGSFTVVDTIHFRKALDDPAPAEAPLSGLAVGPDRVYLSLRGEPYLVAVDKPSI